MFSDDGALFSYIGGPAGCGKTYQARESVKKDPYGKRLTASTGIAAVNLGGSDFTCTTINSLLWYYDTAHLESNYTMGRLDMAFNKLWEAGVRQIFVDEVSMMSGRQLDVICKGIDYLNEEKGFDANSPMGLTLLGDFCQLPSIDEATEGFAFEADHWDRFASNTTILTEIKRQTNTDFVDALRAVRRGEGLRALDLFKPRMDKRIDIDFQGTTIMAKNKEVDRFNDLRLGRLQTSWVRFPSYRGGRQLREWEKNIPQVFETKIDALVMILTNKRVGDEFEYVNGDLGYLRDYTETHAVVELMRNGNIVNVEYISRDNAVSKNSIAQHEIEKHSKEIQKVVDNSPCTSDRFRDSKRSGFVPIGVCDYMPLRTSFASTVHKTQGLTLDVIQVNINNQFFNHGGMTYVALSRARSLEGLSIVCGNPGTFVKHCRVHPKTKQWL